MPDSVELAIVDGYAVKLLSLQVRLRRCVGLDGEVSVVTPVDCNYVVTLSDENVACVVPNRFCTRDERHVHGVAGCCTAVPGKDYGF